MFKLKIASVLLVAVVLVSVFAYYAPSARATQGRALVMSSIDKTEPFGYYGSYIEEKLKSIGYTVTILNDEKVTVDLLLSGLSSYDVVIWRTDSYSWAHRTYWYVGEVATQWVLNSYSNDFADYALDYHAGIVGVNLSFFQAHYSSSSLSNVKLAILLFSGSNSVATEFAKAGAQGVVFCVTDISLQFGLVDDLAGQVVAYLALGYDLNDAVWTTVSPYLSNIPPEDPLDSTYSPPFWYLGDGSLTLT